MSWSAATQRLGGEEERVVAARAGVQERRFLLGGAGGDQRDAALFALACPDPVGLVLVDVLDADLRRFAVDRSRWRVSLSSTVTSGSALSKNSLPLSER